MPTCVHRPSCASEFMRTSTSTWGGPGPGGGEGGGAARKAGPLLQPLITSDISAAELGTAGNLCGSNPCGETWELDFTASLAEIHLKPHRCQPTHQAQARCLQKAAGLAVPAMLTTIVRVECVTARAAAWISIGGRELHRPVRFLRACLRHPLAELVGSRRAARKQKPVWPFKAAGKRSI